MILSAEQCKQLCLKTLQYSFYIEHLWVTTSDFCFIINFCQEWCQLSKLFVASVFTVFRAQGYLGIAWLFNKVCFNCMLLSYHVRVSEWIYTLYLPECHETPCLKQARYLSLNDSNENRNYNYLVHNLIILPVWLNGWVFVYELSSCGFETRCCHLSPVLLNKMKHEYICRVTNLVINVRF